MNVNFSDVLEMRWGVPCGGHGTQQGGRQNDSASKPVKVPGPIDIGRSHDPHDCADCENVELVDGIVELPAIFWRCGVVVVGFKSRSGKNFPTCRVGFSNLSNLGMLLYSTRPRDYDPRNANDSIEEVNWDGCVVEMLGIRRGIRENG
jgi:hypothetical protein